MALFRASRTPRARHATGEWPEALRTHAASCPVCRDVALVAAALGRDRRHLPADPPLASAGRIWWMAQLRARHAAAERATRPISVMTLVAIAVAAPVAAGALASVLPFVGSWLAELRLAEFGGYATLSGMTVAVSAGLAVLLLALARVGLTGTDR